MKQINLISSSNNQVFSVVNNETGKTVYFSLFYRENQSGWFMDLEYNDVKIDGIRIVTSGNMLHQFRNLIPFGLKVECEGNQEPVLRDDFSSKRAIMYLLTSSEVTAFSEVVSGQAST